MTATAEETTVKTPTAAQAKAALAKAAREAAAAEANAAKTAKAEAQALRNRLRNEAQTEVLNNHREEFVALATAKFAEHGLEFAHRKTDAEKAADKIAALLKAHPELASQFGQGTDEVMPEDDATEMPTPVDVPEVIYGGAAYAAPDFSGEEFADQGFAAGGSL